MKQMMLEIVSNKWAIQNTRTSHQSECRLRTHRDFNHERTPDPLICQISRQFVECCSDEAQFQLQRKLHQVAEGSRFIEQRLRVNRHENDVSCIWWWHLSQQKPIFTAIKVNPNSGLSRNGEHT